MNRDPSVSSFSSRRRSNCPSASSRSHSIGVSLANALKSQCSLASLTGEGAGECRKKNTPQKIIILIIFFYGRQNNLMLCNEYLQGIPSTRPPSCTFVCALTDCFNSFSSPPYCKLVERSKINRRRMKWRRRLGIQLLRMCTCKFTPLCHTKIIFYTLFGVPFLLINVVRFSLFMTSNVQRSEDQRSKFKPTKPEGISSFPFLKDSSCASGYAGCTSL